MRWQLGSTAQCRMLSGALSVVFVRLTLTCTSDLEMAKVG